MTEIMLDLETLSTKPNAHILSIGAVQFDQHGLGPAFYTIINPEVPQPNAHIDAKTVHWWMAQSAEARAEFDDPGTTLAQALDDFSQYLSATAQGDKIQLWGNGAAFDNVILRAAFDRCGITAPWSPFSDRCYRTLKNLAPHIPLETNGTPHNAINDAANQAEHAVKILTHLNAWQKTPTEITAPLPF